MDKIKGWLEVGLAWLGAAISGLTLDKIAITLTIIYTTLQISTFIYPWHKKLWKKFGETH